MQQIIIRLLSTVLVLCILRVLSNETGQSGWTVRIHLHSTWHNVILALISFMYEEHLPVLKVKT